MLQLLAAYRTNNLTEKHLALTHSGKLGGLTFSLFEGFCVTLQFVNGFIVFIFFDTVMHDPSTSLEICNTIFENGCPDRYACVHRVVRKIKSTHRASIHPTTLLFQAIYELNCLNLRRPRDRASREY